MRAIYLDKAFPDVYRSMVALSKQADAAALGTGLPMALLELVKLRASQLNGCAYCLRKHTRIALDQGESTDRIAVLQNWRDTGYFTEQEQAALELVEEITLIADVTAGRRPAAPRPDVLTDEQIAAVRWVGLTINAFNRLSITSEHPVDPPAAPAVPAAPAPQPADPAPGVVEELSEFMHSDDRDE